MGTWKDVEADAPEFAERVRTVFTAGTNKTIATLRADGSPRISGTELEFQDGQVTLGMMAGARKLRDVRRDPRVAIHSPTIEPPQDDPVAWPGDAKVAGRLVETAPPADTPHVGAGFFRLDLAEVAMVHLGETGDHLVIESWHPGRGYRRRTRA
ncbi:pyridoxamine 5-phosphate oxidase [Actinophytocola xinjiangensis]|uniref:Pyridoxamine 5-phosphate oxidase n=1 Tax=Actinophytocola xinjiangensis TaxID=485602 RepID=A0A7Z1AY25_9PSEU|nr:pyridoxamine 5'-phosphate oxidase family protein [Actinophytocola xinjiangensis]OLF10025.1 pyridoxamine 5-phosphate oxidase [Actinophytocola xinjiangensis]